MPLLRNGEMIIWKWKSTRLSYIVKSYICVNIKEKCFKKTQWVTIKIFAKLDLFQKMNILKQAN